MQDSLEYATLQSFPPGGLAVVIGSTGGVGAAVMAQLMASSAFADVIGFSRGSSPALDLTSEATIAAAARDIAARGPPLRLVFVATGFLHDATSGPEKSWRDLDRGSAASATTGSAAGTATAPPRPR